MIICYAAKWGFTKQEDVIVKNRIFYLFLLIVFTSLLSQENDPYRFFRGNKTTGDIIAMSKQSFTEFDPTMKEFQLSLDIDPLDKVDDCGGRCDAFAA